MVTLVPGTRWADVECEQEHLLNVFQQWEESTPEERAQGARWYADALAFAQHLSTQSGLRLVHCVAVLAVSSQQLDWERNMLVAQRALLKHRYTHPLPEVNAKMAALVAGGSIVASVRGEKVFSFFQNIMGEQQPVTVDRHIYSALQGQKITGKTLSAGEYHYCVRVVQTLARWLELPPSTLQATIWLHWRNDN